MLKRTITGAVITIVAVGFFMLRQYVDTRLFLLLIFGITLLATYEINVALGERTSKWQKSASLIAVGLASILNVLFGATGILVTYLVFACLLFLAPVFFVGKVTLESVAYSLFALVYPAVLLIPLTLMNDLGDISFFALVLTFIISPCADVFA